MKMPCLSKILSIFAVGQPNKGREGRSHPPLGSRRGSKGRTEAARAPRSSQDPHPIPKRRAIDITNPAPSLKNSSTAAAEVSPRFGKNPIPVPPEGHRGKPSTPTPSLGKLAFGISKLAFRFQAWACCLCQAQRAMPYSTMAFAGT